MTAKKKKTKFDKFMDGLNKLWKFIKKVLAWLKEILAKKSVKIGLAILIAVMFMLGFSINWQCGSKGWRCGGGYTPPNPDDVNKILKIKPDSTKVKRR